MPVADYANIAGSMLVEGKRKAWRRNFNAPVLSTDSWVVSGNAPGMTYPQAGGALTVNMGTNANEELIITSVDSFQLPFRVQFHHSMNQRIANNEVYLEVVNAAGNTYMGWMFDGTTTTQAKFTHANGGNSSPASPTGAVTITGTSTTPVIREINCHLDAVDFSDRTADTSSTNSTRQTRSRTTLDPDERYFIRLRFKNTGTAPASNTINTFETILVQDTNDVLVEVSAGRGDNSGGRSLPVTLNNSSIAVTATPSVSSTSGTACTATRNQALSNAGSSVKGSAGRVFGFMVSNVSGASGAWFNLYNATSVTVGTTTPLMQVLVPPAQTVVFEQANGVTFSTGINMAATDTSAPLSAAAPAAALVVTVLWI